MKVKIAGTLTAAQEGALHRAKAYHGKQPYQEFFADCVIWYKNDWAVVIPMQHTVPYYWESEHNSLLTGLTSTMATDPFLSTVVHQFNAGLFGDATITTTTEYQLGGPAVLPAEVASNWPSDTGSRVIVEATRPTGDYMTSVSYGAWFTNGDITENTGGYATRDPSALWQTLSGTWFVSSGPEFISPMPTNTVAYTPFFPSYETVADEAAWNAHLLGVHTAAISAFMNASPPVVSNSPSEVVTVTVPAAAATAYATITASTGAAGISSVVYGVGGDATLTIATVPMTVTLIPDLNDAEDPIVSVDFFRNGSLIATVSDHPFTYDLEILATETATYSALYTDESDVVDTATLTVSGLLSYIDFYKNGAFLATSTSPPYVQYDAGLAEGEYTYSATIHDDAGDPSAASVSVEAVGPALTGDALSAITDTVPSVGVHDAETHGFAGSFWQPGGIARVFVLSPIGTGARGMYFDHRLSGDLTQLQIDGSVKVRCGSATNPAEPFTIISWVPASGTLALPSVGSVDFPKYVVYAADAANYGEYPLFGWWYDAVEQAQKVDMAATPPPDFQTELFNLVRDTIG